MMREGIDLGMENLRPQFKEEEGRERWFSSEPAIKDEMVQIFTFTPKKQLMNKAEKYDMGTSWQLLLAGVRSGWRHELD